MSTSPRSSKPEGGFLARRRATLLASAIALGVAGTLGVQAFTVGVTPARAESSAIAPQAAPALPSFADVADRVRPAVVSVRVKTEATGPLAMGPGGPGGPGAPGQRGPGGIPGLDQLPDDHPLKRFFKQFGQGDEQQQRRNPRRFGMSQGSGFFISGDGYVVTNNHVVANAKEVELVRDDAKTTLKAKVVGTDPRTDVALLKVEGDRKDWPYVTFADNKQTRIGDWVIAVGNPFGLGGTVTAGIVSARGRDIGAGPYDDFLQIDAAVNHGNSGGPTFNLRGEVVGVNTAIYSPSGGNVGVAFSIPAEIVTDVVAKLKDGGVVERGYIGVQIQPVTDEIAESLGLKTAQGALVAEAQSGTPGEKAGLKSGDVIQKVNGESVAEARDLSRKIASFSPGTKVELTYWRDGKELKTDLTLGKLPDQQQASLNSDDDSESDTGAANVKLGIQVTPASRVAGSGDKGLVVTGVDDDGQAAGKLEQGDVILEVGGREVTSAKDVTASLDAAQKSGKRSVLLRVKRNDATRFVPVEIGRG
ncbi:Do family serine endopeptidase [Methylopila henanensis]|uniref:Probable periplasmic serine endoprotease DegP-like n=1 Tax=Methylopila henanensis TaxID=873516 RepID=A0ABW4K2F2_9HYPH